ncbi:MAG: hypothetical protein A2Y17_10150 [Clostridiales bacterium GWF2_38_85]|nr:MAG: hypothetical protein A2Y17_10150 [Clostridiales bacterium GWF2_38_85]HBL84477.1 hypothetical protein [Clostridiales bacterium]
MDIEKLAVECEKELEDTFRKFDSLAYRNTKKILDVFIKNRVSATHFAPSDGYGYGDNGRDLCDKLFAEVMEAEAGFARHSIVSGTHALNIALFGLLRPNDTLFSVTGTPYDTLHSIIGITECEGSLVDFGVKYRQAEKFADIDEIKEALLTDKSIKVVYIQRSRGYDSDRPTLSVAQIGKICDVVHTVSDAYVMVDNCYGELCEEHEPPFVGADLTIGSLIKNLGGGMAETGGYIVGTKKAVELSAYRLTAPGIGLECGASLGQTKNMIKGLFFAPHVVAQALKAAAFAAKMLEKSGFDVSPKSTDERFDIIQSVRLGSAERICSFCEGIQAKSPIDSHATPEPWDMPGYDDPVIMAAGTFTQGASIELSADAPMRPPYTVYMQGGLTYESAKIAIMQAIENVMEI